jgi:hypothetical protein
MENSKDILTNLKSSIIDGSKALENGAEGLEHLSSNFEHDRWLSLITSSEERCKQFNLTATDGSELKGIDAYEAVREFVERLKSIR